jgi:hypothetical protein
MTAREKAMTMNLPPLPWTYEALGEEMYNTIARELGYFDPRKEKKDYRPSLDPTPFKDLIKATSTKKEK